ncbi:MAG: FMN-binding protein, partial [Gammaproteobacteria bacterium]|nr:FMN-binding protein [Gammaproteobacteria bacterium]
PMPSTPLTMFRAIVGIGMLCALLIVGVYAATAERIAKNEAEALRQAVAAVMPAATRLRSITIDANGKIADINATEISLPAFIGYDDNGTLVGAAITAAGMGYQDTIQVIYAYSFDAAAIVGMRVLQSLETPGLGTKIETDPAFIANFEKLDVSLNAGGDGLAHPVVTVPHGTKEHPWQIDAITGATVSSDAIGRLLDNSAQRWVPVLAGNTVQLRRETAPAETQ